MRSVGAAQASPLIVQLAARQKPVAKKLQNELQSMDEECRSCSSLPSDSVTGSLSGARREKAAERAAVDG